MPRLRHVPILIILCASTLVGGCVEPPPDQTETETSTPTSEPAVPENITREGLWIASAPSVSTSNAEVIEVETETSVNASLSISVERPSMLEYVVYNATGDREIIYLERSDIQTDWTVHFLLPPGSYEVAAILRIGGPTEFVVHLTFEAA